MSELERDGEEECENEYGVQEVPLDKHQDHLDNLIKKSSPKKRQSRSKARIFTASQLQGADTLPNVPIAPLPFRLFQSDFKSFLHACVNANMIERAHSSLIYYRYRNLRNAPLTQSSQSNTQIPSTSPKEEQMIDVDIYNIMMKAWAGCGRVNKVKELMRLMKLADLTPNVQSYSCHILCLMHVSNRHMMTQESFDKLKRSMQLDGVDMTRLILDSRFNSTDTHRIRHFVQHHLGISVIHPHPSLSYNCLFMKDFNTFSASSLNIPSDSLTEWTQEQINREMKSVITVDSVFTGPLVEDTHDLDEQKDVCEEKDVCQEKDVCEEKDASSSRDDKFEKLETTSPGGVCGGQVSQFSAPNLACQPVTSQSEDGVNNLDANSLGAKNSDSQKQDAIKREKMKKLWDKMEVIWRQQLRRSLEREIDLLRYKVSELQGMNLLPYLISIDMNEIVNLMMDEISNNANISQYFSPPIQYIYRELGQKIRDAYMVQIKIKSGYFDDMMEIYSKYLKYLSSGDRRVNSRIFWYQTAMEKKLSFNHDLDEMGWSPNVCKAVGKFCFDLVINNLKIDPYILKQIDPSSPIYPDIESALTLTPNQAPNPTSGRNGTLEKNLAPNTLASQLSNKSKDSKLVPILFTVYKSTNEKCVEELRPHPVFLSLQKGATSNKLTFQRGKMPMLSPPVPWISPTYGCYLIGETPLFTDHSELAMRYLSGANLDPILDSLNALSLRPWIINKEILDVAVDVFNNHGNMELDIPVHASKMPGYQVATSGDVTRPLRPHPHRRKAMKQMKDQAEMYSLWCTCLYRLSIANHVINILIS